MCMEWVSGRPFIRHGKKREVKRRVKKKKELEKRVIFNPFESEQLSTGEHGGGDVRGVRVLLVPGMYV